MKVLIGTPTHQAKDYVLEKWVANVKHLTKQTPADILLVDNSPTSKYVRKIESYCQKHRVKNFRIDYLKLPAEQKVFERVARCREAIRQEVLNRQYDAWFSWECDQLVPLNTLKDLLKMMSASDMDIVALNGWLRNIKDEPNFDFGVALINRRILEKYSFILQFGSNPQMPTTYEPSEMWFRRRVIAGGGKIMHIDGVITPIRHI